MKLLFSVLMLSAIFACKTGQNAHHCDKESCKKEGCKEACNHKEEATDSNEEEEILIEDAVDYPASKPDTSINATIGSFSESDLFSIESAQMIGDKLFVKITYSGGCQNHSFEAIGSSIIMKSLPPKRVMKIIHNGNGDVCRKLETKTLEINVSELSANQESGSETILLLAGFDGELKYVKQ